MKAIAYFSLLILFLIILIHCERVNTPYRSPEITLTVEGVGVTEAWLKLHVAHLARDGELEIQRNNMPIFRLKDFTGDTLIYDSGLEPKRRYEYRMYVKKLGKALRDYPGTTLTTMDTTSHNFTWEIYEFPSPYGTASLYDAAIVDENDIWVVGEIYSDSANPAEPYNAVHWDGQLWKLKRINYKGSPWPITAVYAFSSDNVWFEAFVRWDGANFIEMPIPDILIGYGINKIWGLSKNDFYVVGNYGLIAHKVNQSWQKVYTGAQLPIHDIWGDYNSVTVERLILCLASEVYQNRGAILLKIRGNKTKRLSTKGLSRSLHGLWFKQGKRYYIVGDGLFEKRDLDEPIWQNKPGDITNYYLYSIRGTDINNVFAVGSYGEVLHYNGLSWKSFFNQTSLNYGAYKAVAVSNNIVVAVGIDFPNGVILIGKKTKN